MNILDKLTIKHLKMNKKRTLVTIIGITLSTALMVGIGLLVSSVVETEKSGAIDSFGAYHASFKGVSDEIKSQIEKNVSIEKSYAYSGVGFAKINSDVPYKPYLYVVEANTNFLNELDLIEGVLPTNSNELLISEHILEEGGQNYKIGDTITLDIGPRVSDGYSFNLINNNPIPINLESGVAQYNLDEIKVETTRTYKIVGIVAKSVYEDYDAAGFMVFSLETKKQNQYHLFVEYKKPQKAYELTENIVNHLKLDSSVVNMNDNLLFYYGTTKYDNVNSTFLPLILIALSVISIGCIVVIYNSFAISTMERKKSFGLYASIGTTTKQIKKTVLFEAFIVGTIGILLGLLGGFLGIYIVIQILNHLLADNFGIPFLFKAEPIYIIIPLLFMIMVILISAFLPAKRASKTSPIEAIRGNDDIKISKKEVRTPKFIQKIFGIEGDIAYKNIKRNKKKYRITIISLFISIVLFNTFTTYLDYIIKGTDSIDYYDYDIRVSFYSDDFVSIKKDMQTIEKNYKATQHLTVFDDNTLVVTNLNKTDFTTMYQNTCLSDLDLSNFSLRLIVLDDQDYNKLTTEEAILLNDKYYTEYKDNSRKTYSLEVFNKDRYTLNTKLNNKEVTLNALVYNKNIWGLKSTSYSPLPILIIPLSTYLNQYDYQELYNASYILNTQEYKQLNDDIENKIIQLDSKHYVDSPSINNMMAKNLVLALKILFYGFIALVTLIGVTSVINTINTSMNLRRKEFAMLRSVGLSPRGFNKMLFFESLFFGLKSLIYAIPVSLAINFLIAKSIGNVIETGVIISWNSIFLSILGVFFIVILTMSYASKKIKKENILETLREENI